jgi:hypothetical protein
LRGRRSDVSKIYLSEEKGGLLWFNWVNFKKVRAVLCCTVRDTKREERSTKICDKVGQRRRLFEPEQFELGLIVLLSKRQLKSQIAN